MSLLKCLEEYKNEVCYGGFCSTTTCGKYSNCRHTKELCKVWYPDMIKDQALTHVDRRGIKSCDVLGYKSKNIFLVELKPSTSGATTDVNEKIEGTCKILKKIYSAFGREELKSIKAFLVRCNPGVNSPFRDALSRLSVPNKSSSLYKNNEIEIDGIKIPVSYCAPCTRFFSDFFNYEL